MSFYMSKLMAPIALAHGPFTVAGVLEQLVPSQLHGHVGFEGERKAMLEHLGFSGVVNSTLR